MTRRASAARLGRLPHTVVLGYEVPVAIGFRARLLGLAHLDRKAAGPGLLIPGCSSVHTFGMRFALDLTFLNEDGEIVSVHRRIPARRVVFHRRAHSVLEIPSGQGGEILPLRP